MTAAEVMSALEGYGSESARRTYTRHGITAPMFGVLVGDMKKILKKTKTDHALALELYETGNFDAMYLAALMADAQAVTADQLRAWARASTGYMVSEYGVAALAAESPHGRALGLEWIDAEDDKLISTGWATLAGMVAVRDNSALDLEELRSLLQRVRGTLHTSPNRARYTMNGFVIAVGSYVPDLTEEAREVGRALGKVSVDLGDTACKVPAAPQYIQKVADAGRLGKKRKSVRC